MGLNPHACASSADVCSVSSIPVVGVVFHNKACVHMCVVRIQKGHRVLAWSHTRFLSLLCFSRIRLSARLSSTPSRASSFVTQRTGRARAPYLPLSHTGDGSRHTRVLCHYHFNLFTAHLNAQGSNSHMCHVSSCSCQAYSTRRTRGSASSSAVLILTSTASRTLGGPV